MYIACPRCDWRPAPNIRWVCTCGHEWHTFDTHGVCPNCGKVWTQTQCMVCANWSDHEEWYHEEDNRTIEEFLTDRHNEHIKENWPRDLDL
jgi:predicted amidophosphoribosyltransferase